MHGIGVFVYPDGVRFEGEYVFDKKEGFGHYLWPFGDLYKGYWVKGKQHGLGVLIKREFYKYGLWIEGKRVSQWFFTKEEALNDPKVK